MITATSLKILSTTENIIACAHLSASRPEDDYSEEEEEKEEEEETRSEVNVEGALTGDEDKRSKAGDVVDEEEVEENQADVMENLKRLAAVVHVCDGAAMLLSSTRPSTVGMHLDLDGTEIREPPSEGADQQDVSISPRLLSSSKNHSKSSSSTHEKLSSQRSQSPYGGSSSGGSTGSMGCSIFRVRSHEGSPIMATLLCDDYDDDDDDDMDAQNGNDRGAMAAAYVTPTVSYHPPNLGVRCLPTGSSQEEETLPLETKMAACSPRASPVGQEDEVQATLYEDIADLEEKVRFCQNVVCFLLCVVCSIFFHLQSFVVM